MPNITQQDKSHPDMRLRENREGLGDKQHEHLTKDGQPDHRYKENREDQGNQHDQKSNEHNDDDLSKLADIPTKKDGTADMRYAESKEAVSSGIISKDEVIEDAMNDDSDQNKNDSHLTKDGQPDHRYKENRQDQDEE